MFLLHNNGKGTTLKVLYGLFSDYLTPKLLLGGRGGGGKYDIKE